MSTPTPSHPHPSDTHQDETSVQQPVDLARIVSSVKKELGVVNSHKEWQADSERELSRVEDFLQSRPDRVSSAGITIEPDPEYLGPTMRIESLPEDYAYSEQRSDRTPQSPLETEGEDSTQVDAAVVVEIKDESIARPASHTTLNSAAPGPQVQETPQIDTGWAAANQRAEVRTEILSFAAPSPRHTEEFSKDLTPRLIPQVRRLPSLSVLSWIVTVLVIGCMLYYLYDDGALNPLLPDALQRHNPRIPPSHQFHH